MNSYSTWNKGKFAMSSNFSFVYTAVFYFFFLCFCTEYVSLPCKLLFRLFLHLCVISFTQGQKWEGNDHEELKYLYAPQ